MFTLAPVGNTSLTPEQTIQYQTMMMDTLGQQFLESLITDKSLLYVICGASSGDVIIACGFLTSLLNRKRKKACVLIIKDRYRHMDIDFVGAIDKIFVTQEIMEQIKCRIYNTGQYETDNYIYASERWDWKNNAWIRTEGVSALDAYRRNILSVPDDAPFMPPIPKELTDINKKFLHKEYIIDRKRTIILVPCYSGGRISSLEEMWHELVKELNTLGYVVYTNIGWSEKPLNGTLPMITTMSELNYLANKINCGVCQVKCVFIFYVVT